MLYLDENGDMPSEKTLRKRGLTIGELRRLGIEPATDRKRRQARVITEVLLRDLNIAAR